MTSLRQPSSGTLRALRSIVLTFVLAFVGCGGEAPSAPTPTVAGHSLSGVVSRTGGSGIVGARVEITSGPGGARSTLSDDQGRYTLADLPSGDFGIRASATGMIPRTANITLSDNQVVNLTLDADAGEGEAPGDRFRIAGVVRAAADGAPVAGAVVEVMSGTASGQRAESDSDGRYVMQGLRVGEVRLRATAANLSAQESSVVLTGDATVDFALPASVSGPTARFSISGVVYGSLGLPIGGAQVRVTSGRNTEQKSTTDAGGRYRLSDLESGRIDLEASGAGHVAKVLTVTLTADRVEDFRLQAPGTTRGRVVGVLTQEGIANVSIGGDGVAATSADGEGGFQIVATTAASDVHQVRFSGPTVIERQTTLRVPGANTMVTLIPAAFDLASFDEMLRAPRLARWTSAPPLLVERRVVAFEGLDMSSGTALEALIAEADADGLIADLSWALPQLSGGTFGAFASTARSTAAPGDRVALLRPNAITVVRVEGLFERTGFEGYGRWLLRADGAIIGGLVMLDRGFEEAATPARRLLRAHELGHALGYQHLTRRPSIMSPNAPVSPTSFDLEAFRVAFARPPGNLSPDIDPSDRTVNKGGSGAASWGPPIR